MGPPLSVQVTHHFSFAAEKVFDAWLTPSVASRFFFATRTGNIMRCEIDAVEGGGFVVTDRRPLAEGDESVMDAEHRGTYVEIARPRRLVFDFSVPPYTDQPTRVTIAVEPQGPQACVLTLTHDLGNDPIAQEHQERTRRGWTAMLMHLDKELAIRRIGVAS